MGGCCWQGVGGVERQFTKASSAAHKNQQKNWRSQQHNRTRENNKLITQKSKSAAPLVNVGKNRGNIRQETIIVLLQWPVDNSRATNDIIFWHKAPISRIRTTPAIITQHKIVVWGYDHVVDILIVIHVSLIVWINIFLFQGYAIYYHCRILNGDRVAW